MATNWQPPPVARAWTRATTGWGIAWIVCIIVVQTPKRWRTDVEVLARHLGEVVPRAEESSLGREDHPRRVAVADADERLRELLHQCE